jgi:hypothetical protein
MSEQSRITVVGARKRIDVAVPSWTPIGEYTTRLAAICGQEQGDVMPPAWSLAVAGEEAFPLDACLVDVGVIDGQVLYLRDTGREPAEAPVVAEVDEVVAEETRRLRAHKLGGGPATIAAGLLWLTAGAVLAGWHLDGGAGASIALILAALLLLGVAWSLAQQRDAVPYALRVTVALTAVPCLAAGGVLAGQALAAGAYPWESGLIGANLAALLAFATLAEGALFAVQIELVIALMTAALIRGLAADRAGAAAVTAVVAMGVLALARRLGAFVASWSQRRQEARRPRPVDATVELVGRSRQLLAVVLAGPAAALAVALPVLAASGKPFALGLTGAVCLVLMVRVRQAAFTCEVIAIGAAAAVGCFALVLAAVHALGLSPGGRTGVLMLAGVALVGFGAALCVLTPPAGTETPQAPKAPGAARRRSTMDVFGVLATTAMTPLAMGVFGVFGQLLAVGRTMF